MKQDLPVLKRTVILLWGIAVTAFLFFISVTMKPAINMEEFVAFTVLLWGGGIAYHVTTQLLACPQDESNKKIWLTILGQLAIAYIGYVIVGVSLFFGVKFGGDWGWILAYLGVISGGLWAFFYIFGLEEPINELLSS